MIPPLSLKLPALPAYIRVAVSFVENSILSFTFEKSSALSLMLATEEIFSYLCRQVQPGTAVTIQCAHGVYFAHVEIFFHAENINLQAFNITTTVVPEETGDMEQMGLYLAARMVDRFSVTREQGRGIHLTLVKEKSYQECKTTYIPSIGSSDRYQIHPPEPEEIGVLAGMICGDYGSHEIPDFFHYPNKVTDMAAEGDLEGMAVFGSNGTLAGGLVWRWLGSKTVEFFGPYLFGRPEDSGTGRALLESCINRLARTGCISIVGRYVTDHLETSQFQTLGETIHWDDEGRSHTCPTYIRLLGEDMGSSVWTHPDLAGWIEEEYSRLVFPRTIQTITEFRSVAEYSVLAADLDRFNGEAVLRPILSGSDIAQNMLKHLRLFENENMKNIRFTLDLGTSWHAEFTPYLLDTGFSPRLILPYAGRGDLLVFQHDRPKR